MLSRKFYDNGYFSLITSWFYELDGLGGGGGGKWHGPLFPLFPFARLRVSLRTAAMSRRHYRHHHYYPRRHDSTRHSSWRRNARKSKRAPRRRHLPGVVFNPIDSVTNPKIIQKQEYYWIKSWTKYKKKKEKRFKLRPTWSGRSGGGGHRLSGAIKKKREEPSEIIR